MDGKRADFLWIVQMIMIKNQNSIVGWPGVAGDAVAASHRLPQDMTARDAALAFCSALVEGFAGEEPGDVPTWMANLRDPPISAYEGQKPRSE